MLLKPSHCLPGYQSLAALELFLSLVLVCLRLVCLTLVCLRLVCLRVVCLRLVCLRVVPQGAK